MSNGIQTIQAANNGITSITRWFSSCNRWPARPRRYDQSAVTPGVGVAGGNTSTQANNTLTFNVGGGVNVSVSTFNQVNATVSTVTGTTLQSAQTPPVRP